MKIVVRLSVTARALFGAVIALGMFGVAVDAAAQKWPEKPVRLIAPFADADREHTGRAPALCARRDHPVDAHHSPSRHPARVNRECIE